MFIFWLIALVIALSVHEYAHARVADELGDPTPKLAGRLTLNPLAHFDPLGTLFLLLFHFGWGKPVPIDPYNLKDPRRDQALIALAGPGSNFFTALFLSLVNKILLFFLSGITIVSIISLTLEVTVVLNLGLGIFNLMPFVPLDGHHVLLGFLPYDLAKDIQEILQQYSLIIIAFLFLPLFGGYSLISLVLEPLVMFFAKLLLGPSVLPI